MEPYQILAKGVVRPERLSVLFDAFDAAWVELEPIVGADPTAATDAQEKLARTILSFNQYALVDREWIRDAAVAIMRQQPDIPAGFSLNPFSRGTRPFRARFLLSAATGGNDGKPQSTRSAR